MEKEEEMYKALDDMVAKDAPTIQKGLAHLTKNIFEKEMMPRDALGISDQNAERLYAQAHQLYNMGKFSEARTMFGTLMLLDPFDTRFLFGHAACSHMMKEYDTAAETYIKCAMFDEKNPVPFFHAADCYINMEEKHSAMSTLNMAIKRAGDQDRYSVLKKRAEQTLQSLKTTGKAKEMGGPGELKKRKQS